MGPTAVFLPPKKGSLPESAAIPAADALTAPAYGQVAAIGDKSTWARHAGILLKSSPYHGHWSEADVPDGLSAHDALSHVRAQRSLELLSAA